MGTRSTIKAIRKAGILLPLLLAAAFALSVVGSLFSTLDHPQKASIPFPNPVYQIKATSGSHTASLLNLPIGQPGVPQVPVPVDVDGDLLPDVTVAVNLVNVTGLFNNPPNIGAVLAPNIEIDRLVTATTLGQKSPPLNIQVQLSVVDLQGQQPTTTASFGYDTGEGGSIPMHWKATVGGLQNFFNPVEAVVDTEGMVLTGLVLPGSPSAYQGPLSLVAAVNHQPLQASAELRYDPWPGAIHVTYGTDSNGQHITYAHNYAGETDVTTKAHLQDGSGTTDATATIERMPRSIALDLNMANGGGSIDWHADSDGRLPDIQALLSQQPNSGRPTNVRADIEALPAVMHGDWQTGGDNMSANFTSSGQGIGAVEAQITNYNGVSPPGLGFRPYVPTRKQYANFQQSAGNDPNRLIMARVEKIRSASFNKTKTGMAGDVNIGDGEQPLEVHAFLAGLSGKDVDATSVISPLPDHIAFTMDQKDPDTAPFAVSYDASDPLDVDVSATLRDQGSNDGCGVGDTICANVKLRNIPPHIDAAMTKNKTTGEMQINVNDLPNLNGGSPPDFFADVTAGPQVIPQLSSPLVAHAEVLGLPAHVRARVITPADGSPSRAEFHTCDFDYSTAACNPHDPYPQTDIAALSFYVRNTIDHDPAVPVLLPTAPNYVTVAGQGSHFEVAGSMTHISQLVYAKHDGLTGFRTQIGGGGDLQVLADVRNFDPNVFAPPGPGQDPQPTLDIKANVLIDPLPATLDFCMRENGNPIPTHPSNDVTAQCETVDPFGLGNSNDLTNSPMTIAYKAASGFNVTSDATLVQHGVAVDGGDPSNAAVADRTLHGVVNVLNIPAHFVANILTPPDGKTGAIRAHYDTDDNTPNEPLKQVQVHFEASMNEGDLVCADPRVPNKGFNSLCVSGDINDIPTSADFVLDQTKQNDNLHFTTSGEHKMSLTNLHLASVAGTGDPLKAQVLVADGSVIGLPDEVEGTLVLPGSFDLTSTHGNLIDEIHLKVRNYIAPDPLPDAPPAQRTRYLDPSHAQLDAPTQQILFFMQQDLFKGIVDIKSVKGAGFLTSRDNNGNLLDTNLIKVNFGYNQTLRAYADIKYLTDIHDPTSLISAIGDVTLEDLPAAMQVCFRGKNEHPGVQVSAASKTWCDDPANVPDNKGGIQFLATPKTPANLPSDDTLDVDATVRVSGLGQVLAGRLRIDNIPNIIQGTFGDGTVDIGGYKQVGTSLVPDGIDRIAVDAANADVIDDGYGANAPWGQRDQSTVAPLPDPVYNQYVQLGAKSVGSGIDFHARASIGAIGGAGQPGPAGSDLQHILIDKNACSRPGTAQQYPDYPFYPQNDGVSTYTCARVDFEQVGSAAKDPMEITAIIDRDGKHAELRNAGIDNLPAFVQLNLASTKTLNDDGSLRPRCGNLTTTPHPADCMPPLIRLDTPTDTQSVLFGQFKYGTPAELDQLTDVAPRDTSVPTDFYDASPGITGSNWTDWFASSPPNFPPALGIRAKVGTFTDGDVAAKVGIRLQIPDSLTVDQVQSWSDSGQSPVYFDASDFNFHYRVSNPNGVVGAIGQMAALLQLADGTQITLGGGGLPNATGTLDPRAGVPLPGEVGLAMYQRNDKGNGRQLVQIDGRVSDPGDGNSALPAGTPLTLRARLFGAADSILGEVDASVQHIPTRPFTDTTGRPSFRLRAEILGSGSSPPGGGGGAGVAAASLKGDDCSFLLCTVIDIKIPKVLVHFDFQPTGGPPARLLEAVVNTNGAKNGLEVKGWDEVADTPQHPLQPALFDAGADVFVNPLNIFFHAGIPILGSIDFALVSDLHVGVHIRDTSDFAARENIVKLGIDNAGSGPPSDIVFAWNIYLMHGIAFSILGIFLGDPVLFSVDYVGPPGFNPPFYDCSDPFTQAGTIANNITQISPDDPFFPGANNGSATSIWDQLTGRAIDLGTGHTDFVFWPVGDISDGFIFGGSLGGPVNLLIKLGPPIFCTFDVSDSNIPLIHGTPATPHTGDTATKAPDDPLDVANHPVPGLTGDEVSLVKFASVAAGSAVASTDVTLNNASDYCGEVDGRNITLNGTITAATTTNGTHCTNPGDVGSLSFNVDTQPDPVTHAVGTLTVNGNVSGSGTIKLNAPSVTVNNGASVHGSNVVVFTTGDVTMNGNASLDASNAEGSSNASGNSGGGHANSGGNGATGSGGATSGDFGFTPNNQGEVPIDSGFGGSTDGAAAGAGGGTVRVTAGHLIMGGTSNIQANGQTAASGTGGTCGHPAGPSNNPPFQASTGSHGGGGGAGGGVVINATEADIPAGTFLAAVGGAGGASNTGAGGGGAGGDVKLVSPVIHLTGGVFVNGGGAGATNCFDTQGASGGNGGQYLPFSAPASRVTDDPANPTGFWHSWKAKGDLSVPFTAASGDYDGDHTYEVFLCATFADASHFKQVNYGAPNPSGSAPCGSNGTQLGHLFEVNHEVAPDGSTITNNDTALNDGFYGLYTVVQNDNSLACSIFGACNTESLPGSPDRFIGIDQEPPTVTVTTPDPTVAKTTVTLDITTGDALPSSSGNIDNLSGVAKVQCSNDDVNFTTCGSGTVGWTIPSGDGVHTVYVKVTDATGNTSEDSVNINLDTTSPTSHLVSPSAASLSGWLLGPPSSFTIAGDNADTDHLDWWFDGGGHTSCSSPCTVTGGVIPNDGAHSFHWQAVDKVGNMEAAHDQPFMIDADKPLVALLTVPTAVDGSNGWFQENPFFVINAVDITGGSGVNGITYKTRPAGVGAYGPDTPYLGPFQLGPGEWDICIKSQDLAGNPAIPSGDGVNPVTGCRLDVKIDDAAPTVSLKTQIGGLDHAPDGLNGWFVSTPTVVATPSDATPGSGLAATYASVDHKPYQAYTGPITIPEGLHEVRAFTVDNSGQVSNVAILPVKVDLSPAEPAARTIPIDPARNGWFRRPSPAFVLRAQDGDQNAGTHKIVYQIVAPTASVPAACNPLWTTYTGQLTTVAPGPHRVDFCTEDEAGNFSSVRSKAFNIDPDNPIVKALDANPNIWISVLGILGPPTTQLQWQVTEPTSGKVTVSVVVYNLLGVPVRQINEAAPRTVTPGVPLNGSTPWDGKDNTLTGIVPAGVYYYRVVVTDDAGNTAMSGESRPITIKVKLL